MRDAIEKARLPAREYRIYRALFSRAEWGSATIKRQFQPRSLSELADLAHMSKASVCRGLNHLQRHGWVLRHRHVTGAGIGGRGHGTHYELTVGTDCDCGPGPSDPVPDATRMRRYRQRRKASQSDVTQPGNASQIDVTKRLTVRNEVAGQTSFPAKSVSDEGSSRERETMGVVEREREVKNWPDPDQEWLDAHALPAMGPWPEGSIGEDANRVRGKWVAA